MRRVMTAAALLATCVANPAAGQTRNPMSDSALTLEGRPLALNQSEMQAIQELSRVRTMSPGFQDRALATAERVIRSSDGHYALALYQLDIARLRQDDALRQRALDVLIPHRSTPPAKLAGYLAMRGGTAFRVGNHLAASADWSRLLDMQPGDTQTMINLAQARQGLGDGRGAIDLIRRAIAARSGAAEPVPEAWYRQWLSIAVNGGQSADVFPAGHALLSAYPSADNWRSVLGLYRQALTQASATDDPAEIDLLRLMRATGSFSRGAEFQRLAQLLLRASAAAEARAVMEEGIARGQLDGAASPVPEILRDISRAAAQPPRLGTVTAPDLQASALRAAITFATSGRRAEARTALQVIAAEQGGGSRAYAELARFWLIWLAQQR